MSKIEEMLQGVEVQWKMLNEIAYITSAGVDKKINENEKAVILLNYMDVYKHPYIDSNIPSMQVTANDIKIKECNVLKGDIFITPSSEVKNEIGFSSMAIEDMPNVVYSYHIMRIRLKEYNLPQSMFINYLFRSNVLQDQINKQAKGLTRYGLTKTQWEKLQIPLPPLEVQKEIVRILDSFTTLTAELQAELQARKLQYEYYRDELLSVGDDVEWKTLGEVAVKISSGGTPSTSFPEYYGGTIPWLRTQEVNFCDIWNTDIKITEDGLQSSSAKIIPANCVIIAMYGATVGKIAINKIPLATNQACANIEVDETLANYKYVYYYLSNQYEYIKSLGAGSQTNINSKIVKSLKIPIPPLSEQERIVSILDKFDTLTTSLTEGLPKEITLRQQQYEYYREMLFSFPSSEL